MEREFEGRTASVLGGSSGIGLATARLLAERGANVAVVGHADDTLVVAKQFTDDGHPRSP
ncbi:SDR family NAD(P)-dependent oxidoreductase [Mesorhizobium sp. M0184]|uniref:SDR family NAD(P)-dependent oxidoreductase n=1 Tax=Mesorhizobium sp. M0184 TaxID=2956906 RepID=UPI003339423D